MYKLKLDKDIFIAYPLLTSLFLIDVSMLAAAPLIRFPVILSILLVGGLVYLSMFFATKTLESGSAK